MSLCDLCRKKEGGITHPGSFNKSFLCLASRAPSNKVSSLKRWVSRGYGCWFSIDMTPFGPLLHDNAKGKTDEPRMGRLFSKICSGLQWRGSPWSSTHRHSWAELCTVTAIVLFLMTGPEVRCVFTPDFSGVFSDLHHFCSVGIHRPSALTLWCL